MNKLLESCFKTATADMIPCLASHLKKLGYDPLQSDLWVYAQGTAPVLLVAHVDTVHQGMPKQIFHDQDQGVLWSPDGIGADDRAGVYGILALLDRGYRPHVLFTDLEEVGGKGARAAAEELSPPDVNLMVQLDRMHADDAVWYQCVNKRARRWVNKHGFQTAQGSFTDISILMPAWGIAGVNLSVGYYNQHTESEFLVLPELEATLDKVGHMLASPPPKFRFYERKTQWSHFYGLDALPVHYQEKVWEPAKEAPLCNGCDMPFKDEDLEITPCGWRLCSECVEVWAMR